MRKRDLLLHPSETVDLHIGQDVGWFIADETAGEGFSWRFTGDDSGIYEVVDNFTIHAPRDGVHPGKHIFKIKGIKSGDGEVRFDLVRGGEEPRETVMLSLRIV